MERLRDEGDPVLELDAGAIQRRQHLAEVAGRSADAAAEADADRHLALIAVEGRRLHHDLVAVVGRHGGARQVGILERARAEVGRPDRAQRRGTLRRELGWFGVCSLSRQLQPRVPELGAAARCERPLSMTPAHLGRRRDDQPVGQLERGLGVARAGDRWRGGDLGRRRRGSDRGDAVDAEREARPVEHALDGEGDARISRHLEGQPAAPSDANGSLAGRVDDADGGGRRLRLGVGRHVGLQDRRFVVAALGDRLRLEMDDEEGRLVGILDDQRRRLALRPVDPQVARFHVQAQQVVRPDNLEGESHGLPLACRGCRRGAWKSDEQRRVRRLRRDIATLPRAANLKRFESGAQMEWRTTRAWPQLGHMRSSPRAAFAIQERPGPPVQPPWRLDLPDMRGDAALRSDRCE